MLPAAKYLFLWFSTVPWDGLITTFIPREFVTELTTFTWTSHHLLSPSFFFWSSEVTRWLVRGCKWHCLPHGSLFGCSQGGWGPDTKPAPFKPHYQHSLDGCCPKISAACCPACSCPSSHCRERERSCLMPESALFSNSSLSLWYKGF